MPTDVGQREAALAKAVQTIVSRRELKDQVKAREIRVSDVLRDPPPFIASAKLVDVIAWAPQWGPARARKALRVPNGMNLTGRTVRDTPAFALRAVAENIDKAERARID